jgi:signal transduction histidine kinase
MVGWVAAALAPTDSQRPRLPCILLRCSCDESRPIERTVFELPRCRAGVRNSMSVSIQWHPRPLQVSDLRAVSPGARRHEPFAHMHAVPAIPKPIRRPSTHGERVLSAVGAVFRQGLATESESELVRRCLALAEELTFSDCGWIGEVNAGGQLDTVALGGWGCNSGSTPGMEAPLLMVLRGLWSVVMENDRPLLVNSPADDPSTAGLLGARPPVSALIGVPLRRDARAFGLIVLAKREGLFADEDVQAIEHLSAAIAEALLRHRAMRALEASERELKRSNEELQHFAHVASHDLQEPLRKITAFGDLLAQELEGQISDRARDYLERMVSGAHRMQRLINDVLALARVGSSCHPMRPVALQDVVRRVLEDMSAEIALSHATIEVEELPVVVADETQMYQLFQNLLGNALKFRAPGASPRVALRAQVHRESVTIEVIDHGIGIDPAHHERIFQLFQRLHTRDEYAGTGLGLALCQRIVRRHNGDLRVSSALDEGSRFIVRLPYSGRHHETGEEQ